MVDHQEQKLWTIRTAHGEAQFSMRDLMDWEYKNDPVGMMERVARARAERDAIPVEKPGERRSMLRRAHRCGLSVLADYLPPHEREEQGQAGGQDAR